MGEYPLAIHTDTICALATPPGRGALSLIRLSGPDTPGVIDRLFQPVRPNGRPQPRTARLGHLVDPTDGQAVDQVVLTLYPAPHSYTGQDMAEISCHGSPPLVADILRLLCASGARPAHPGEFTQRALLAGKLDLVQAEAIQALIEAQGRHQVRLATRQRDGELSRRLAPVQDELLDIVAHLEAAIEFGDTDAPAVTPAAELVGRVHGLAVRLADWEAGFRLADRVREGFHLVLAGRPNAGKSTLFNTLLGAERAIVSPEPGTTRDVLQETTDILGVPVTLRDTAGLRPAGGPVERAGVERARAAVAEADLVLWVVDSSEPPEAEDLTGPGRLGHDGVILVAAKADRPAHPGHPALADPPAWSPRAVVSARTGEGLDGLRQLIRDRLTPAAGEWVDPEPALFTSLRQQDCIRRARQALERGGDELAAGVSEEYPVQHLRQALADLDELTGRKAAAAILERVFASFCIGK